MRYLTAILFFIFFSNSLNAQQNRLKFGIMGIPFSGAGFGIGSVGYEHLDSTLHSSWQFFLNAAGGSIAADARSESRVWGTAERTFYKKTISKKISWSYSFFTEIGNRTVNAGYEKNTFEKIFKTKKVFEINPGASLGLQLYLGKKVRLEGQAGPKVIFASGKNNYYDFDTGEPFSQKVNEIKAGYRFLGVVSVQF